LSGDEIAVILYLRVLGDLPEATTFNVALMAEDRWGSWKSTKIKGEWLEGKIVEYRGVLTLPLNMPPGDYRLWAALQVETGPLVAEFHISEKDLPISLE
jgi:hypothetical protein